jgi:hypothetical protein
MSNNATNDLRNTVIRKLLSESGGGPELGVADNPRVTTTPGTLSDGGSSMKGGIAGMAGDPSPVAIAALLSNKQYQAIMPLWIELMKKEMGL